MSRMDWRDIRNLAFECVDTFLTVIIAAAVGGAVGVWTAFQLVF